MKCGSDFECGNGENFEQVSPLNWRMNVRADRPGYDHFFHFRIETEHEDGLFRMDILPASDPDNPSTAPTEPWTNGPGILWRKKRSDGAWERMPPDAFAVTAGKIALRQFVRPGETWYFAEACPLPYSDLTRHMQDLPAVCPNAQLLHFGETPERRPLMGVRITDPMVPALEKGVVFILAGQHGTEFAGIFAAQGALDFLASHLPQAATLRRQYVFDILPCANPDGNAHGLGCHDSDGRDPMEAYQDPDAGITPDGSAAEHIWRHVTANVPELIINFHSYAHPRPFGDPPYEGMYVPDPENLTNPDRQHMQRVINHAIFYLTGGGSQHRRPCPQRPNTLEDAAASTWNTLSVLYQVQTAQGPHRNMLTGVQVVSVLFDTLEQAHDERLGLG